MSNLIIGIDPGAEWSAVVWFDEMSRGADGEVRGAKYLDNSELLYLIDIDRNVKGISLAIEMPESRGGAVSQGLLDTACWVGRFDYNQQATLYTPRQIRSHFCGSCNSKRKQVNQDIKDRFGPVGTKANPGPLYMIGGVGVHPKVNGNSVTDHLWDALAVAIMGYELRVK